MKNRRLLFSLFLVLLANFCLAQFVEKISDAKTVIKPKRYKIDLVQKTYGNYAVVNFKLYKKKQKNWLKIQDYNFRKHDISLSVTTEEDLNNDGYKDLMISYAQAARGANEVNKLFIFNPKVQKLVEITNSQDYPNLHYNLKRNCVVSYMFHGGNSTYFLKINKNKLQPFGRVEFYGDSLASYRIKGKQEILLKKIPYQSNDGAVFFSNYDPIED